MEKQKKQLVIVVIILIIAVILYLAVSRVSDSYAKAEEETVEYNVTTIEENKVSRLVFTNSSGTIALTKNGGIWSLDNDSSIEIDETTVSRLITQITPLSSPDCIEKVENPAKYGLDTPAKTIMVSDGDKTYTVFVGDYNDITGTYYICLESDTQTIYTAQSSVISAFDVTVNDVIVAEEETTQTESAEALEEMINE